MKFLSNTYNPTLPNARMYFTTSYQDFLEPELAEQEWKQHLNWINSNVIGEPQGSDKYTVEELKQMGYIGVYSKEDNEN